MRTRRLRVIRTEYFLSLLRAEARFARVFVDFYGAPSVRLPSDRTHLTAPRGRCCSEQQLCAHTDISITFRFLGGYRILVSSGMRVRE